MTQGSNSKKFVLSYGKDEIGYLKFLDGQWVFTYSEWFKNQARILPLLEFPEKNKIYRSKELWSFFTSRIPSDKQPKRLELDKKENSNVAVLLELFGKQTVNNPFILEPQ